MDAFTRDALRAAGVGADADHALAGGPADTAALQRLRALPLPLLCGLADAVRQLHRGPDVAVLDSRRGPDATIAAVVDVTDLSGPQAMRAVACARLSTPPHRGVAISLQRAGLSLSELCLTAGADTLFGDLRSLHPTGGSAAGRARVEALALRNGRQVRRAGMIQGERRT